MKKLIMCSLIALLTQSANATIWLVDNNSSSPQILLTVQAAVDTASVGDTILIEGSGTPYGLIILDKPLTFIGEGYNSNTGEIVELDFEIRTSDIYISGIRGSIELNANAAATDSINNILIERCNIINSNTRILFFGNNSTSPYAYFGHITFRNNLIVNTDFMFSNTLFSNYKMQIDTLIIENNILSTSGFKVYNSTYAIGFETLIVRNNLFMNGVLHTGWINSTLFWYEQSGDAVSDAAVYNNIFFASNPLGCDSCTYFNNLTYQNGAADTLPPPQNANIYNQDPLFLNYPYPPGGPFSYNHDYHLNTGSPCDSAGVGGTDIGIYGGLFPFNVGDGPKIPVVDYVNISKTAVPQGSIFFLQFGARTRK